MIEFWTGFALGFILMDLIALCLLVDALRMKNDQIAMRKEQNQEAWDQ